MTTQGWVKMISIQLFYFYKNIIDISIGYYMETSENINLLCNYMLKIGFKWKFSRIKKKMSLIPVVVSHIKLPHFTYTKYERWRMNKYES